MSPQLVSHKLDIFIRLKEFFLRRNVGMLVLLNFILPTILDRLLEDILILLKHPHTNCIFSYLIAQFLEQHTETI